MHTVILRGEDAINYAAHHPGTTIHEHETDGGDHRVSLDEARRGLGEHPEDFWIEIQTHINSAD